MTTSHMTLTPSHIDWCVALWLWSGWDVRLDEAKEAHGTKAKG